MLEIIFNNRIFQHSLLKVLRFPCILKPQYYIPWEISHLFAIFIRQVSWTSFLSQSAAWEKSGKWCISPSLHVRSWFRWTPRCSRRGWWSRSGRRPWCKSRWPAMLSQTLGRWWECWSRISHSNHHQCQKAEKKTQNMFENYHYRNLPSFLFISISISWNSFNNKMENMKNYDWNHNSLDREIIRTKISCLDNTQKQAWNLH